MPKLSVTIITLDEAAHIAAAIDSASFADEILVVDSGSTDETTAIARGKGARVLTRAWTGYVDQKNFAAEQASHDWIFSLDADERIPPALADEIRGVLAEEPPLRGYRVPRVTFHLGRWIRTTDFYPDYQTRLYDRRFARWQGRYVHESVTVDGPVRPAEARPRALLVQRSARPDQTHQSLLDAVGEADVRGGPAHRTGGDSRPPAGRLPAQLHFAAWISRRNRGTDDLADECLVGRVEVHEALGASKKSQEPNPKSQIPMRRSAWGLEFGSWGLGFTEDRSPLKAPRQSS